MEYDKTQHIILEIEYQAGRIVPVHCYGEDQASILLNGDEWTLPVKVIRRVQM